jgi:hypothetical protein
MRSDLDAFPAQVCSRLVGKDMTEVRVILDQALTDLRNRWVDAGNIKGTE